MQIKAKRWRRPFLSEVGFCSKLSARLKSSKSRSDINTSTICEDKNNCCILGVVFKPWTFVSQFDIYKYFDSSSVKIIFVL